MDFQDAADPISTWDFSMSPISQKKQDVVRKALCDHMQLNKALVEPSIEPPGDAPRIASIALGLGGHGLLYVK